ncbi:MAG: Macrolide export protein MacA [Syntrophomonadaceae bacterium]|nr:Macrolide export protein MacA [Bacillota bacterium]
MKKKGIIAGITILAIVLVIVGRAMLPGEEVEVVFVAERVTVKVVDVVRGNIRETISLVGDVEAQNRFEVYPRVSGKIIQKNVVVGNRVKKGETIALIDRDEPGFKFELSPVNSFLSGIVGRIHVDLGDMVTPHTPVASIVDMDRVKIKVGVAERDIPRIKKGQEARVEVVAYPQEVFMGRVDKISPVIDIFSRRAPVEVIIDNPEHKLKPGMFARVELITNERRNVLIVPRDAVLVRDGREIVYVIENSVAKIKEVETGIVTEDRIELISGVESQNKVIIGGHFGLRDGARVRVEGGK